MKLLGWFIGIYLVFSASTPAAWVEEENRIAGTWRGYLLQEAGSLDTRYPFEMKIYQSKQKVWGTTYIRSENYPDIYGLISFQGTYKQQVLKFHETQIIRQHIPTRYQWCIKEAELSLLRINQTFSLEGLWQGCDSDPKNKKNQIFLKKVKPI